MTSALRALALAGCLAVHPALASDDRWPQAAFAPPSEPSVRARGEQPYRIETPKLGEATVPLPVRPVARGAEAGDAAPAPDRVAFSEPTSGLERSLARANPAAEIQAEIQAARPAETWQWRIVRTQWTDADETGFEAFVRRIGQSDCGSMHECLAGAQSNPAFYANNPPDMHFFADCADLPYMLRAYYAWKNGLPFSFARSMHSLGSPGDLRYNTGGNKVGARSDLVSAPIDARRAIPDVTTLVTTAQFRTAPETTHTLLPDHYPVGITRASIKPGTVIYDAYGHIAVVYDVTSEGRVLFMDSHPDNSLTRGLYGSAFHRQPPAVGGGFKRWRPLQLVGATRQPDGSYAGGRIALAPDRELADWSDEQYYGTQAPRPKDWREARFAINGGDRNYYQFVRLRLAHPGFRYDPIEETRAMLRNLCRDIGYRRDAVDVAIKVRVHRRSPPARLPYNIYGTDGPWEIYSTPSRDARLRTNFKELRDEIARFLDLAARDSDELRYAGKDLRRDLREVYRSETEHCAITYTRSNGAQTRLTFRDVVERLFKLSFDPYQCPERRWGAASVQELSSCPDTAVKRTWYDAQQRLRNQIDRVYDARMDFTLAQLRRKPPGGGVDTPPDIDVEALIGGDTRVARD